MIKSKRKIKFLVVFLAIIIWGASLTKVSAYLPGDPNFGEQWYLQKVKAQQAWDFTFGSEEVVVAVIDSGVDLDHPDLKENVWINKGEIAGDGIDNDENGYADDVYGWDFVDNDNTVGPNINAKKINEIGIDHGTIIAGIIGARGDNFTGIAGMNWRAKIMSLRVLDSEGNGNTVGAVQAIDYAIRNGADIINMSFVGQDYSEAMYQAVKRAWDKGIIIVAATGNDSLVGGDDLDKKPNYPAGYDKEENMVIGVTGVDREDKKAIFSSYGQKYVDIAAPGVEYFSTLFFSEGSDKFNKYYGGYWSGSSVATALVSGVAALVKSLNPSISNEKVRDIILGTADDVNSNNQNYSGKLGKGRLNAYKALEATYKRYFNAAGGRNILIGAGQGRKPEVKILDAQGILVGNFLAYAPTFYGGVKVAGCDLNNDAVDEIITGAGAGGGPQIRIFNKKGESKGQFFAYDKSFRKGIEVACGDVNGDGKNEIVASPGIGGGSQVKMFDAQGKLLGQFYAYGEKFKGGVNIAVRDINKDGKAEILTGPASGGGPQVRIFNYKGGVIYQFFAFATDFRGGISVGAGELNDDGVEEIVVAIAGNNNAYVRVFDGDLRLKYQFTALDKPYRGGINIAVSDLENDGLGEIIVGTKAGFDSKVRVYNIEGKKILEFSTFENEFKGGVNVGVVGSR